MQNRAPFILRLMPSFADFAFLAPLLFVLANPLGVRTLLGDCDTGWHIRTGQWIVANQSVPHRDIFSFSKPEGAWFAWEWLSDVLFAGLHRLGGLQAVVLFSTLLLSATFALVFYLVRRKSNAVVAIVITVLATSTSSIHWLARPHLFTILFAAIFYAVLEQVKAGHTRFARIPYLAILPVLTALWTNLHGGFFVGIVMLGIYGAGEIADVLLKGRNPQSLTNARNYFVCALACLAASLVNPYGVLLHRHMLDFLGDSFITGHLVEYLSPDFHNSTVVYFEIMLVLGAAAACWNVSRGRFTEPLLLLTWAHASLLAGRNIPIFAVVAALPIAAAVQEWMEVAPLKKLTRALAAFSETDAAGRLHLVSGLAVALMALIIWAPNPPEKFRSEFDPKKYPSAALATLRTDPSARIFTDDEWGDYVIWTLYPGHKVFVDGRADFYGDQFEQKFDSVLTVNYDWERTLHSFGVNTILLPVDAPLAGALRESSRWRLVFNDGLALVFRPAAGNGVV